MKNKKLFIFLTAILGGCAPLSPSTTDSPVKKEIKEQVFAITNVNVISMTSAGNILSNATVVITNDRITSINGAVPQDAKIIAGNGKWIIPGLIDMHVHLPTDIRFGPALPTEGANIFFNTQDVMTPYIASGVTTVLDLNSKAEHFGQRNEIARGNVIGPRIALAALINGGEGSGRIANTAGDGRQAVRSAKAEKYEFIKVYSSLNVETYTAIIDEADKQGLKTIGHIPNAFQGKLKQAFVPHFGIVAHAEELAKQSKDLSDHDVQEFAQLMKANGTWLCPTLTAIERILEQSRSLDGLRSSQTLQYVHPLLQSKWLTANNYNKNTSPDHVAYLDRMANFNVRLVRAMKAAGVPIVAGTDAGVSGVVGGFSMHDEIELLVAGGLTSEEAITSATRLPATWLGIDKEVGTVEAGKRADLILLDENPLNDIKNIRKIAGVFINGHWLNRASIDKLLSDLSKKNTAARNDYDWNKTIHP